MSVDRRFLELEYRRRLALLLEGEARRREAAPLRRWLERYEFDPIGFIGELVPGWYGRDWLAWRVFIKAVFGLGLGGEEEWEVYRRCTGRDEVPGRRVKEVWAAVGRRGGKSRVFALLAVWLAVCQRWDRWLVEGEEAVIPVLADARDRAMQTMGYVKAALSHPRLRPLVRRELAEEVYLTNSVVIKVTTASIKAARSRTVPVALCDEIAFWQSDELGANPDREILRALRPAMLTVPDSMLFALSSPYARKGMLWEQYRDWFGKSSDRILVWQAPTEVMHPSVPMDEIEAAYRADPVAAAAEYGAQFRSDVEVILPREAVDACVVVGRYEVPPSDRYQYRAFVDPSGGSSDSMVLAIAHYDGERQVSVLDLVREVRPPFSPEEVTAAFSRDLLRYGVTVVYGDRYGGEWPRERFAANGIEYRPSDLSRSELYIDLIPSIMGKQVELLDNTVLVTQLTSLERRPRSGAKDLVDHPPGGHDDVANAVAGAFYYSKQAGRIWTRKWSLPDYGRNRFPQSAILYARNRVVTHNRYIKR